jgi:type IV pilus assembly protein PilY1
MIRDESTITKSFNDEFPTSIKIDDLLSINSDPFGNALSDEDTFRDVELSYSTFKGWKYSLTTGEKSLSKPSVVGGVAYFSTFTAADESNDNKCSLSGGGGSLYAFHLHYGTKVYDSLKFDVGDNVPDTPQLFFDKNDDFESQFLLIGVGKGEDGTGVVKAKSILENIVPKDVDKDGTIDLIETNILGLQTVRSYIYRQEKSSGN